MDYCKAPLTGLHNNIIRQQQLVQNAAARILTNIMGKKAHLTYFITAILKTTALAPSHCYD